MNPAWLTAEEALSEVQKGVDACSIAAETLQILRSSGAAAEKLLAEGAEG